MPIPLFDQSMLHRKHYHNFGNDAKIWGISPSIGTTLKDRNNFINLALTPILPFTWVKKGLPMIELCSNKNQTAAIHPRIAKPTQGLEFNVFISNPPRESFGIVPMYDHFDP